MNDKLIILLLLLLSGSVVAAQKSTRQFEIRVAGFKIGDLTATQTILNDSLTEYSLQSKVSIWAFYRIEVIYSNTSRFLNGQLISSTANTITNKGDFHATTSWQKDHYEIKSRAHNDYELDTIIRIPIKFNIAKMYFELPKNGTKVYADAYGVLAQAEFIDDKKYLVEVLGNRNKYYFKNGILLGASMDNPIKNYEVKPKE